MPPHTARPEQAARHVVLHRSQQGRPQKNDAARPSGGKRGQQQREAKLTAAGIQGRRHQPDRGELLFATEQQQQRRQQDAAAVGDDGRGHPGAWQDGPGRRMYRKQHRVDRAPVVQHVGRRHGRARGADLPAPPQPDDRRGGGQHAEHFEHGAGERRLEKPGQGRRDPQNRVEVIVEDVDVANRQPRIRVAPRQQVQRLRIDAQVVIAIVVGRDPRQHDRLPREHPDHRGHAIGAPHQPPISGRGHRAIHDRSPMQPAQARARPTNRTVRRQLAQPRLAPAIDRTVWRTARLCH